MTTVSSSSIAAILVAFAAYLLFMIVIGAICMRRTNSSEDYFLGGRGLNAWVAALSAQASDMSGWLLMGLPGSIYALGTGQAWIARTWKWLTEYEFFRNTKFQTCFTHFIFEQITQRLDDFLEIYEVR